MIQLKAFFLLGLLSTFSNGVLAQADFSTYNQDTGLLAAPGFYQVRNRQSVQMIFLQANSALISCSRAGVNSNECTEFRRIMAQLESICHNGNQEACRDVKYSLGVASDLDAASISVD